MKQNFGYVGRLSQAERQKVWGRFKLGSLTILILGFGLALCFLLEVPTDSYGWIGFDEHLHSSPTRIPFGPFGFAQAMLLAWTLVAIMVWVHTLVGNYFKYADELDRLVGMAGTFAGVLAMALLAFLTYLLIFGKFASLGWPVDTKSVRMIDFSADGQTVLVETDDHRVYGWAIPKSSDMPLKKEMKGIQLNGNTKLPAKTKIIFFQNTEKDWVFQDADTGQELGRLRNVPFSTLSQYSFSPDGRYLAAVYDEKLQLWRIPSAVTGSNFDITMSLVYWLIYIVGLAGIGIWLRFCLRRQEDKSTDSAEDVQASPVELPLFELPPLANVHKKADVAKTCSKCGQVALGPLSQNCRWCGGKLS